MFKEIELNCECRPMLARLQGAIDLNDLIEQMPVFTLLAIPSGGLNLQINLVIGYNSSPSSQWLWTPYVDCPSNSFLPQNRSPVQVTSMS